MKQFKNTWNTIISQNESDKDYTKIHQMINSTYKTEEILRHPCSLFQLNKKTDLKALQEQRNKKRFSKI